ncbi:MAG: hypothetical protein ACC658_12930 [Acidimicrobiia bacterium]
MSNSHDPIACSLPLREAASQALEWTDLHRHVVSTEQLPGGLAVTYRTEVADVVEELVAREASCCRWLSLSTSRNADGIKVELASDNPDAWPVIQLLAGRS